MGLEVLTLSAGVVTWDGDYEWCDNGDLVLLLNREVVSVILSHDILEFKGC
jgi:hypothetical protein